MFEVKGDAVIATATELRREAGRLLERVDRGESVVIQRNAEPIGVLVSYDLYRRMMSTIGQMEDLKLALLAMHREEKLRAGADELVRLEALMQEFGVEDDDEAEGARA